MADGIEHGDPARGHDGGLAEVVSDQWKVGIAGRDQGGGGQVEPEGEREPTAMVNRCCRLEVAGTRIEPSGQQENTQRDGRGDEQHGESRSVFAAGRQDRRDDQGPDDRTRLVHRLVQPETPAMADLVGGV